MILGVNTFLYTSRFTDSSVEIFPRIAEVGFDGVEITLQEPGDFDPGSVKAALDSNGLSCLSLCGLLGECRDLRGSGEEQEASRRFLEYCIDTAARLGCRFVSGPLYSRVGRAAYEEPEARELQLRTTAKHLADLCDYAARREITLGIEPLIRFETDLVNTCEEALNLIERIGRRNIGVHLDTFHMNVEELDPVLAVVRAGERLVNLHCSDNNRGAPGTGSFGWEGLFRALKFIGYTGPVILESFHPDAPEISYAAGIRRMTEKSNDELARRSHAFLSSLIG
ncbi:MAG: sugar phosphate isomerase/epimerase family protein [Spirochaetia bacterium]